jgi:SAM-dependent methyltransferase
VLPIARRVLRGSYQRTAGAVREEYDPQRSDFLDRFRASDWTVGDYTMREAGDELDTSYYFANVIDGELIQGRGHDVRARLLERLRSAIEQYGASSVTEVGSGTGRNLLFLKDALPELEVTGLELSPPSVDAAREAAERFGLEAQFHVCDVTGPWPTARADIVFSVHALEQIPGSEPVIRTMTEQARTAVVLFEPLPDLWRGLPGLAGRLRASYLDRLRKGAVDPFDVRRKVLLPEGMALNRTTEVHLAPPADTVGV